MGVNIISLAYKYLCKYHNKIKWKKQLEKLPNEYIDEKSEIVISDYDRCLIIVPHADDELIGCYHFMSKHNNVRLFFCNMTGSRKDEENSQIRRAEFESFCSLMKIPYHIVSEEISSELKKEIQEYQPQLLLVTTIIDWHDEHRAVNYILQNVLNQLVDFSCKIGWYAVTCPIPMNKANFFVPVDKANHIKKGKVFSEIYLSQKNIPIERFLLREQWNARNIERDAAEIFWIMNKIQWCAMLDNVNKLDFSFLKESISSLDKIYYMVQNVTLKYGETKGEEN